MFDKQAMLEAHVQFELQRWHGAALRPPRWRKRSPRSFARAATIRLNDVVTPTQVMGVIQRIVIDMPLADELVASIGESVQVAFELLQEDCDAGRRHCAVCA